MSMMKRPADPALCPRDPATGEALEPKLQPGYYPGFSTLSQTPFWDATTRGVVEERVENPPERKWFSEEAWKFWTAVFAHVIPQTDRAPERQIPIVAVLDNRLAKNQTVGYRYEDMPHDRMAYALALKAIDLEAEHRFGGGFVLLPYRQRDEVLKALHDGEPEAAMEVWREMSVSRFWEMLTTDAVEAYYSHPWAWDEIGFGGPAYPRAYTRLERGEAEPWEVEEQRYAWAAPSSAVSDRVKGSTEEGEGASRSHHGSGGAH